MDNQSGASASTARSPAVNKPRDKPKDDTIVTAGGRTAINKPRDKPPDVRPAHQAGTSGQDIQTHNISQLDFFMW